MTKLRQVFIINTIPKAFEYCALLVDRLADEMVRTGTTHLDVDGVRAIAHGLRKAPDKLEKVR